MAQIDSKTSTERCRKAPIGGCYGYSKISLKGQKLPPPIRAIVLLHDGGNTTSGGDGGEVLLHGI